MDSRAPPAGVLHAISIIERVGSIFSLAGCLFIIVTFLSSSAFRKPINRLMFYASFGNMLVNVGTLIARAYVAKQDSVGCQLQGFLIQQFLPSDALWALAMAFNVYLTFYWKYDAQKLRRIEKWYLLICYGVPLPPALAFIFISTEKKGRIYGDAILWCWVSSKWDILRIATFYGPIWVILAATFFIYIRAGGEIYRKRRQLRKLDSSSVGGGGTDVEMFKLEEAYPVKTTEISVTSESATQPKGDDAHALQNPKSNSAQESEAAAAYSITISSDRGPRSPRPVPSNKPAPTNLTQAKVKRRKNHDLNSAAWAYTKCAILFFTALAVTWLPSSANRVYSVVHGGETVVALEILSAIVLPLQGTWNAVIYIVTSWAAVKLFFSELLHHAGHGAPSAGPPKDQRNLPFTHKSRSRTSDDTDSMTELAGNAIPMPKSSRSNSSSIR
ncbi:G-protein coupled receptor [Xylaria castorea]|nr:G-protein coupled receptor [Xylaria castorea]